jgi:hypothetical protein
MSTPKIESYIAFYTPNIKCHNNTINYNNKKPYLLQVLQRYNTLDMEIGLKMPYFRRLR